MNLRSLPHLLVAASLAAPLIAGPKPDANARLDTFMDHYWQYVLRTSPETATYLGDSRYNDRLQDVSRAAVMKDFAAQRAFLAKTEAFKDADLNADHRLDKELLIYQLKLNLEGERFKGWEMPLNQMGGPQTNFPQLLSVQPMKTAKDAQDYLARLRAFPKVMDDTVVNMRSGIRDGITLPKLLTEETIAQVQAMLKDRSIRGTLLAPLDSLPAALPNLAEVKDQAAKAVDTGILPAYARLLTFLETDYLKASKPEPGEWALPDGKARYAYDVKVMTTTDLSPAQIHETGLKEVARIEGEMTAIAKAQGYADLASFRAAVVKDPRFHPKDGAELLARYKSYLDGMRAKLPDYFGILPKAPLVVMATEPYREKDAPAAEYQGATPDGSRPGRFYVDTYHASERSMLSCESTSYHEGIPGHHMQISIAQELKGVPEFRKEGGNSAYAEGWALYCEGLGKEMGFYKDPYSDYGRLSDEMLRAVRLVVDTGVHDLHWTRQQMVDYFHAHTTNDEVEIQAETDRYIAWPGQALSYKVGQLTILRLREKAKAELGAKFDIKAFHDLVLGAGALPMSILERRVDDWIAAQKKS
ncbi:MAG: DUF885 domain-containing protein [Acidobacteria bacterium]|nr:DUF885 domain-containing protein [Acidobacteriota bacterium]